MPYRPALSGIICGGILLGLVLLMFGTGVHAADDSDEEAEWIDRATRFILVNDFRNTELYGPALVFGNACAALSILADGERDVAGARARVWWDEFPWGEYGWLTSSGPSVGLKHLAESLRGIYAQAHTFFVRAHDDTKGGGAVGRECRTVSFAEFRHGYWRRAVLFLTFDRLALSLEIARDCNVSDLGRCGRKLDVGVAALIAAKINMLCHLATQSGRYALCEQFPEPGTTYLESARRELLRATWVQHDLTKYVASLKSGAVSFVWDESQAPRTRDHWFRTLSKFVQVANGDRRMFERLSDPGADVHSQSQPEGRVHESFFTLREDRYMAIYDGRGADLSDLIVSEFQSSKAGVD